LTLEKGHGLLQAGHAARAPLQVYNMVILHQS
ncbi:hypothetical protein A2U01_0108947, partial [Trifolium medium]|nr:hypothetical protein [Trifolium medium]